jgi:glycerol kinase
VLLGIDQGTTGTLACLVEADGRIAARAYAAHRQICPRPGWVEHDAEEIWRCVERVVGEVLAQAGDARPDGVALANQGETVLLWDRRTGRPLHHALVWQDTRTQPLVGRLAEDPAIAARVREETGLPLDPYFSAPKLRWLLDEVPGARALAAAGHLRAGTLDAWLIERLTGGGAALTDPSTAARTLLYDTRAHRWSAFLLELFGVPPGVLPEVRDTDAGFGACAALGLGGAPIVASLVDQPAALAGHGCVDAGDAKATFGTGCFVYASTGAARPRGGGTLATVAWKRTGAPACYALDGGVLAAGSAIGWLRELGVLGEGEPLDAALAGARRDPGVVCVPALVGLGAPHWDRDARAAWLGMSSAATRADLTSALVEGIACRVAEVVAAIEREAGLALAELRVDGGLTRSPALMQLQADLLGRPIAVAEQDEATVVGACAIAALRLGALTEADLRARRGRARARYEPRISGDERGARLDRFARAREVAARWR